MQIFLLDLIDEQYALLNEQESKHCIKVLRHQIGDLIDCIDGKGKKFLCKIEKADIRKVELQIVSEEEDWGETSGKIILAISPLRLKDRFEWALEKAVELGVDEIYPILCKRTDLYKSKLKIPRLETLLLSATKQCKRSRIPQLHTPINFEEFLALDIPGIQLMGYCEAQTPIQDLSQDMRTSTNISLLIGPEGDFTAHESRAAQTKGIHLISLGENRLRTETAAIFALSSLKYLWSF